MDDGCGGHNVTPLGYNPQKNVQILNKTKNNPPFNDDFYNHINYKEKTFEIFLSNFIINN